ncbi:Trichohyalin, putative [Eimeria mitis]|uniref:Trichohyalin, putative n=1 Tax=Eimeria mitis TaxID=44415 RepID=U6JVR9_9EIME|nr:Trichohyalin, putative [Eimeria mitis]CDJ29504.1 Trichohyalin, putative [Eimeria mitis]
MGKPKGNSEGDGAKVPNRAGSMPAYRWQPSQQDSLSSEVPSTKDVETAISLPSTHRGPLGPCTSEDCQALVARLRNQVQNLREEKSQLESLIFMQQQTIHQIDRVSMEDKLRSSSDAVQRLNEHIADLRTLLATKDKEIGELRSQLEDLRRENRQARELAALETERLAKANSEIEELADHLQMSERKQEKMMSFLQLGSPEELESLAARNSELVDKLAEKEEAVLSLRRQLSDVQENAEESAKEKDEQLENLRRSLADLREKAEMAEPLLRLGSPDTLQSLVTKNSELVGELAEKEEAVLSLKRQLSEVQENAEGRNIDALRVARLQALQTGSDVPHGCILDQERSMQVQRGSLESAQQDEELKESREREKLLYQQLQEVQFRLETLKKENQMLKHALMNTAQESVDKEDAILRDKREYDALQKAVENATRNAEDSRYLAQVERERRIAQVTQLKTQLARWQRKHRGQHILVDVEQYDIDTGTG